MISNKKHNEIVSKLKEELRQASDFKELISKLVDKSNSSITCGMAGDLFIGRDDKISISNINEDVAVLVDDFATGNKVFKHMANTVCIRIDKDGKVLTGKTAESPCTGKNYKLIEE